MSWHGYFSQPPRQYAKVLGDSLKEETGFAIVDLIKLSQDQMVIADVGISPEVLRKIFEPSRVICLFAPEEMTRKHYFDRKDKQDIYQLVTAAGERQSYYDSGFYCIEHRKDDTIERTLKKTKNILFFQNSDFKSFREFKFKQKIILKTPLRAKPYWCGSQWRFYYKTCIYAVLRTFQVFSKPLSV